MDQSVLRQRKWSTNVFGGGKPQMKEIICPFLGYEWSNVCKQLVGVVRGLRTNTRLGGFQGVFVDQTIAQVSSVGICIAHLPSSILFWVHSGGDSSNVQFHVLVLGVWKTQESQMQFI
ncbi:hypothetical protein VNO78_15833 [Psophocarpus tetragonolobus]|uniref:Uncharacterized protein n=1 Tax=Psophocarpus tetragonolobus TaxID=3891 RepID=A0AAN9SL37_PSOTE